MAQHKKAIIRVFLILLTQAILINVMHRILGIDVNSAIVYDLLIKIPGSLLLWCEIYKIWRKLNVKEKIEKEGIIHITGKEAIILFLLVLIPLAISIETVKFAFL